MKLIQEYIIKICIAVFTLAVLMELYILFLLMKRSPKTFDSTYHQTMEKSESKAIEITGEIEKFISNLLMKYTTDLKLICKHTSLLNGKATYNSEKLINTNSNIFNINNNKKMILKSNLEELKKSNITKKYFNESSDTFEYIHYYEKEFKNNNNNNIILNTLFSDLHQELNAISYYSISNDEKIFTKDEKLRIKFIISILKTIFVKRYIANRNNTDYIHLYIINQDEIFIYPPESYNKTLLYNFDKQSITSGCNFQSKNKSQQFPLCVYNSIIRNYKNSNNNFVSIVNEKIHYESMYSSLCLKFPFVLNNPNQAILCIEMDISKTFNGLHFSNSQKFEFGVFSFSENNTIPLIYGKKNMYNEIKKIFSDFEMEKYKISEDRDISLYSLFHFLYYNLTQLKKNHSELDINFEDIDEEFNAINNRIIHEIQEYKKLKEVDKFTLTFNKTICRKALLGNSYECLKDEFEMIIFPLLFNISNLNDDFLEIKSDKIEENFDFYIYSIISTNPYINNEKINLILKIKIERTIILFIFLTIIIICFLIFFINLMSEYSLSSINTIIVELKNAEVDHDMNNYNILTKDIIFSSNKEVNELKQIYESMRKLLIIKQVFDKEKYLDNHNMEFFNLINKIKNKDIKEICNSFIGFYHFKNESYNLADNEFRETLLYILDNESKIIAGKINDFDDKIKDAIKRSSTVSYINEYSIFEKIDENVLDIIQIKILKQRFIYLYAMTKYKLGCEANNNQNIGANNNTIVTNKNKSKKNKDKRNNYLKDSIKYFTECKNINISLGINQIKVIYSLIMISKCYMELNDYKNSIINISEALNLFFELSKTFKEYHSKYYNPKVMLFVENNIFHFILYNIQRLCFIFKKPYASNWIILKIFETSPFLISNVHFHSGLFIQNFLDKTKAKLGTIESRNVNSFFKEFELTKQYFSKITQRMNIKNINTKKNISNKEIMIGDSNYSSSNKNKTETKTHKSNISSLFKKDLPIGRMINSFHTKNKNANKIITLCVSEKVLKKINGPELKDVIIKYFQKYFTTNENDKFSYIQFANNGKKTIYFKMENLDYFIQKIQKTKSTFEVSDLYVSNSNIPFMELYNIFDSILKNYPPQDDIVTDNIIFMFINSDDIRFTSEKECMNIVKEINKKNTSVFLLSYDKEINQEKINNIQSFLNGLFEGYFFQIKNYQHIKQIFTNISTNKYQSNFFGYDFGNIDHEL